MFNIGMGELLVILLVALVVVGPSDLPKLARAFAKALKRLNRTVKEMRALINLEEDLELKEFKEAADELKALNPMNDLKSSLKDLTKEVDDTKVSLEKADKLLEAEVGEVAAGTGKMRMRLKKKVTL